MGFNSIALYYDRLARFVFGKSIVRAQTCFLGHIPPASKVLVVGGGTGWWLNGFFKNNPTSNLCYVEESSEMIRLAKSVTGEDDRITFREGTQDSIVEKSEFDAVVLFFFLDIFSPDELTEVIAKIGKSVKPNALWLVTDFVETSRWHSILLFIMYRFFRMITGLKNQRLPLWQHELAQTRLIKVDEKLFGGGFIKSVLYNE